MNSDSIVARQPTQDDRNASIGGVFAAMGSPTRLAILARLADHPHSVNEVVEAIGASQANVSQQLGLLKKAGLVRSVRTGSTVTYSTDGPDVNRIIELTLEMLNGIIQRRFAGCRST